MQPLLKRLTDLRDKIGLALEKVDLEAMKSKLEELNAKIEQPGFWDDTGEAQTISKNAAFLQDEIKKWECLMGDVADLIELVPLSEEENDASLEEYELNLTQIEQRWESLRLATYLSGKFDRNNAIVSVYCGLGGKDAQDFTQMLVRMYLRYAEKEGFTVEILEESAGDEVGLKSYSMVIRGLYAFGYLKNEHGVHRLIRLSPFNAGNTRETSFAKVDVIPELDFKEHVEINAADLRIDTYRASGAGGQHVNTTDSAVRITHLPTGIVVQCQNQRSQIQNKERALQMLQGRLQQLMLEKKVETIEQLKGEKTEVAWGHQIRTYTLHPYTLVKDHRTNLEIGNVQKVLDGDLEELIKAGLME